MFDPTKPVQTRDGRKVEILRSDINSNQPIAAIVTEDDGAQSCELYDSNGHFFTDKAESVYDLINIPEKLVALIAHNPETDKYKIQVGPENARIIWEHGSDYEVIAQVLFEKGDGLGAMR